MKNTDLTLNQLALIDDFLKKNEDVAISIEGQSISNENLLCIPIGNETQLGTLLSRTEQLRPNFLQN